MGHFSQGKRLQLALVLGAAMALQGCVAAAVPIAAGGILGERSISANSRNSEDIDARVEVATSAPEEQVINSDLAPASETPNRALPPATSTSADFTAAFAEAPIEETELSASAPVPASFSEPDRTPAEIAPTVETAAPVADVVRPLPTPVPSTREPIGPSGINQLLSYANQLQIASEEAPSAAMLSNRSSLEPAKAQCGGITPTILIDLDPEGGLFDPQNATRPPSGLGLGLARLRLSGVKVAWISGNEIDQLDAINRTLAFSGLDINNEDRVLLVRSEDDRKQTLRVELAQISCLIAIAGDTRSDFDELYDYLKNPADAQSLEALIGDGWFLIPQPLL